MKVKELEDQVHQKRKEKQESNNINKKNNML